MGQPGDVAALLVRGEQDVRPGGPQARRQGRELRPIGDVVAEQRVAGEARRR
jgi:hypothetical protein